MSRSARLMRVAVAFASVAGLQSTTLASIQVFEHAFNLRDDYTEYLESANGAHVHTEGGGARYWMPSSLNQVGTVVYHYPISFEIDQAYLEIRIAAYSGGGNEPNFDPNAEAHIDISSDGINWTSARSLTPGSGGLTRFEFDITSYVQGATDIYVRARLYSTVSPGIYAQYLRTDPGDLPTSDGGQLAQYLRVASAHVIPEPKSVIIWAGLLAGLLYCTHRKRNR